MCLSRNYSNANSLRTALSILICTVVTIFGTGCPSGSSGSSSGDSGDNTGGGPPAPVFKEIALRVKCGIPERGITVHVDIYDEANGVRVYSGNSVERPPFDGAFFSLLGVDVDRSYQIQFRELGETDCFYWVRRITESTNPIFFWDNPTVSDPLPLSYVGSSCSNWQPVSGCYY